MPEIYKNKAINSIFYRESLLCTTTDF